MLSLPLQHQFHERIAQLVYTFPEDAVTSTGSLFWSAPKRFPHALDFDPKDPAHAYFAQAAAILRAEVYGIPRPAWALNVSKVLIFTPFWWWCESKFGIGLIVQISLEWSCTLFLVHCGWSQWAVQTCLLI